MKTSSSYEDIRAYWDRHLLKWEKTRYGFLSILNPASWAIRKRMRLAAHLVEVLNQENSTWLDLGCGSGTLLRYLNSSLILKYIGVDVSRSAILYAREKYRDLEGFQFIEDDLTKMNPPASFGTLMLGLTDWLSPDVCERLVGSLSCEHLIISYTKKSEHASFSFYKFYHRFFRRSSKNNFYPVSYVEADFFKMLTQSGFELISTRSFGVGPGRLAYFKFSKIHKSV